MHKISGESILTDLMLKNSSLIPVVYWMGIQGNLDGKTIHQICKDKALNESYVLNLLLVYTDEAFVPSETLPSYSVLQLSELSSAIYPYFLNQLDFLIQELQKTVLHQKTSLNRKEINTNLGSLKTNFAAYRQLLSERFENQKLTVLPHISTVYELYYSPDYTSERTGILDYSYEFYDVDFQSINSVFGEIKQLLEQTIDTNRMNIKYIRMVYAFYQLNREILAQVRVEQKLLKPLVIQMEESIITTFRKKNKYFKRNNYLSINSGTFPVEVLTHREKEVLQLVAQGLMNKEIADKLQIGLTTVISHRKNIVAKLGIKTIPGLTVYAYTQGYLDDFILTNED